MPDGDVAIVPANPACPDVFASSIDSPSVIVAPGGEISADAADVVPADAGGTVLAIVDCAGGLSDSCASIAAFFAAAAAFLSLVRCVRSW